MNENKIKINFELSKELFEQLRQKAKENELSYSAYLRQLIKKEIQNSQEEPRCLNKFN